MKKTFAYRGAETRNNRRTVDAKSKTIVFTLKNILTCP